MGYFKPFRALPVIPFHHAFKPTPRLLGTNIVLSARFDLFNKMIPALSYCPYLQRVWALFARKSFEANELMKDTPPNLPTTSMSMCTLPELVYGLSFGILSCEIAQSRNESIHHCLPRHSLTT